MTIHVFGWLRRQTAYCTQNGGMFTKRQSNRRHLPVIVLIASISLECLHPNVSSAATPPELNGTTIFAVPNPQLHGVGSENPIPAFEFRNGDFASPSMYGSAMKKGVASKTQIRALTMLSRQGQIVINPNPSIELKLQPLRGTQMTDGLRELYMRRVPSAGLRVSWPKRVKKVEVFDVVGQEIALADFAKKDDQIRIDPTKGLTAANGASLPLYIGSNEVSIFAKEALNFDVITRDQEPQDGGEVARYLTSGREIVEDTFHKTRIRILSQGQCANRPFDAVTERYQIRSSFYVAAIAIVRIDICLEKGRNPYGVFVPLLIDKGGIRPLVDYTKLFRDYLPRRIARPAASPQLMLSGSFTIKDDKSIYLVCNLSRTIGTASPDSETLIGRYVQNFVIVKITAHDHERVFLGIDRVVSEELN